MSEKLFIKVNKKRGLVLKIAGEDMKMLISRGMKYVKIISGIVRNILEHIDLKDLMREIDSNKPEGYDYTSPFNENDLSLVEKAFDNIKDLFISMLIVLDTFDEDPSIHRALERLLTKNILKGLNKVEEHVNKIDSIITKIKREEFSADIHYAINAIKGLKAFTLKTIKELAMLYVRG